MYVLGFKRVLTLLKDLVVARLLKVTPTKSALTRKIDLVILAKWLSTKEDL